jgi:chromosome segregation ATPase
MSSQARINESRQQAEALKREKAQLDQEIQNEQEGIKASRQQVDDLKREKAQLDQEIQNKQERINASRQQVVDDLKREKAQLDQEIQNEQEKINASRQQVDALELKFFTSLKTAEEQRAAATRFAAEMKHTQPGPALAAKRYVLKGNIKNSDGAPAAEEHLTVLSARSGKFLCSGKTDTEGNIEITVPERDVIVEVDGVQYPQQADPA